MTSLMMCALDAAGSSALPFCPSLNVCASCGPCCDDTSSDDDEHNTCNTLLLFFADDRIAPVLLRASPTWTSSWFTSGCRFALDNFNMAQQEV